MSCEVRDIEQAFYKAVLDALTVYELERSMGRRDTHCRVAALASGYEQFHDALLDLLEEDD